MSGSVDRGCGLAVNQSRRTIGYACVLTFALLTAATTPALADVGPPVKVRLLKETTTKPATSGADYSTVIEVVAGADGTIDSFKLSGEGWDIRSVGVTTPRAVRAGEMIPIRFNARPADSEKPLRVSLTFNGRTIKQTFLFSAKRFEEGSRDGASVRIDALTPAQTLAAATEAMDRRAASSSDPNPPPVDEGDEGVPRGDSLRVFGRLVYQRSDGMILGADAMWFQIMDEDDVSDEAMASGFTNANGEFDITFEWDDCDVGCDDPDVYIRWETDNEVVNVQRADLLEEDYSWSTADDRWDDFTGPFIDFGTLMPADLGQHPAIHIHNTINKAHHFILLHDGTDLVEVDALWPEGETGAYYDGTDQEIHIGINQQWIEGTIIHEYGHHYINNHATPWQPDYCNDFCDTDEDDCGHCGWCMETDHDAWSEGWPNWLGGAVMRTYNAYYNYTPLSINDGRYNVEMLGTCGQDNQAHPADITEAYLTAMLQDIEDLPNPPSLDDHDGGAIDCEMDAMALGFDEIFLVTRLDRPTSPLDFINKWRARYPQYDQDFWSTARNVAAIYGDFAAPTPIILAQPNQGCGLQREGESLALSVTGNGALLKYQWRKNLADLTNGGAISGADTNALLINPVQPNHGGMYDCVVITCDGTLFVISEPVHVHVFPAPGNGFQVSGFGRNDAGQLGNGVLGWPTFPAPYVREVENLSDVVQVSGGQWHTLAVKSDGTVWVWGSNQHFNLGQGNNQIIPNTTHAIHVPGLTDIIAVVAETGHSMALQANGRVWVWGLNSHKQLGNAPPNIDTAAHGIPVMIPEDDVSCAIAIAAGPYSSFALKADGTVLCWGHSANVGLLGNGLLNTSTRTPVQALGLADVTAINCGGLHMLALKSDGNVWGWGVNNWGQLGDGTFIDRHTPVQVLGLGGVTKVRGGLNHSLALKSDQSVRSWGYNGNGQLGDGTQTIRNMPVQPVGLTQIVDLDAGEINSIFLKSTSTVWTCGGNADGQQGRPYGGVWLTPTLATALQFPCTAVNSGYTWCMVSHAPTPPYIGRQPTPQTTMAGAIMRLTPDIYGTPPLVFQWYHDGEALADGGAVQGAHAELLTINPVSAVHAGDYDLNVTNDQDTLSSDTVQVTVVPSPFCDDFTGGPSPLWGNDNGGWSVANGSYKATSGVGNVAFSALPFELTDYVAEVDIVNANNTGSHLGGLWVRLPFSHANTGLLLANLNGNLAWYTYNGGNSGPAINQANNVYTVGAPLHLRIEVTGNTFKAHANGAITPTTEFTTTLHPSGRIGLRGSAQSFDNICVSTNGPIVPPDGNMDGIGAADGRDVQPFVAAILAGANDPNALAAADFNSNGVIDVGDVPGFVQVLVGL